MRLETFDIGACLVDTFLEDLGLIGVVPCVRRLVVTDGDGIFEQISRMNDERQAVNTVATKSGLVAESVSSGSVQRIACDLLSALLMNPYVRRIYISDMFGRIVEVTREDIEAQHEDTVATTA